MTFDGSRAPATVTDLARGAIGLSAAGEIEATESASLFGAVAETAIPRLRGLRAYGPEEYKTQMMLAHFLVRWLDLGLPAFEISADLLAGLALTDPGEATSDDVFERYRDGRGRERARCRGVSFGYGDSNPFVVAAGEDSIVLRFPAHDEWSRLGEAESWSRTSSTPSTRVDTGGERSPGSSRE